MRLATKEEIERLEKAYPTGARVELVYMNDPQAPPSGTLGTVEYVDCMGDIGVAWDTSSHLKIIYNVDCCKVVK